MLKDDKDKYISVVSIVKVIEHKLEGAKWCPSPNFNQRPQIQNSEPSHTIIDMLVVHNISLPPNEFGAHYIEDFFCNQLDCNAHEYFETIKDLQVSSHLLIKRNGDIVQFVPFNERAWHAGLSEFKGKSNCNDFSIGIELEGADHIPYEDDQYQALAQVTQALMDAYPNISRERLVGHSDIAPGRKTDPGPSFDWQKYKQLLTRLESK